MAAKCDLSAIARALESGESFLVASHTHPDGDSVGSMLAMCHLLRAMGKTRIACVSEGPVPRIYQWLPGVEAISEECGIPMPVDVAVIVDVAKRDRLGPAAKYISPSTRVIILDHHLEESPDGDLCHINPNASAIGEILVDLYEAAGIPITREAAECVYVSITTDTGGFRFANTTPRSHQVASELLSTGIDVSEISSRVFDVMSPAKFELLRRTLQRTVREAGGRLAYAVLTAKDMAEAAAGNEDADGLVNYLRNIEGVEVGILFREVDEKTTKVSIRSRDGFNCATFLAQFGGGGHARAAGATLASSADCACKSVLQSIRNSFGGAA